jgi:hypothetical protein
MIALLEHQPYIVNLTACHMGYSFGFYPIKGLNAPPRGIGPPSTCPGLVNWMEAEGLAPSVP